MRLCLLILPALLASAAPLAAREPVTPEQRIDRLERQVRQVQRSVFPKGQPAETAGFVDTPAATQESVTTLSSRLDAVERQMSDLLRTGEENSHRLGVMEADLARLRADNDTRFKAIESGPPGAVPQGPATSDAGTPPPLSAPVIQPTRTPAPVASAANAGPADFTTAGEAAYQAGYDLWSAKKYDAAITQLRAMVSGFPGHRRVSWANNLIGRALLDKGEARPAATAFLANYRGDKNGERAPDSLYYLGQSLVKLGQLGQACKAYAELQNVYAVTMRPQLKSMLPAAMAQAKCS